MKKQMGFLEGAIVWALFTLGVIGNASTSDSVKKADAPSQETVQVATK